MDIKVGDSASLTKDGEFRKVVQVGDIKGQSNVWIDDGDGGGMNYPVKMLYAFRRKGSQKVTILRPAFVEPDEYSEEYLLP